MHTYPHASMYTVNPRDLLHGVVIQLFDIGLIAILRSIALNEAFWALGLAARTIGFLILIDDG